MSNPEYREDVYLADGHERNTVRGDNGAFDLHRDAMSRDALRETRPREAVLREFNREPFSLNRNQEPAQRPPVSRLSGTPLAGNPLPGSASALPSTQDTYAHRPVPPGRALSTASPASSPLPEDSSAMQRAMGLLKQAAPFVARLLPLIEGNVTGAVSNLLSPRPHPPAPPVDLAPVHDQLSEIQLQHNDLRTTVQEQTTTLKRVEDRLEMVREATDRNTLEQQELIEDLKSMGSRVSRIALGVSLLLLISIAVNLWLYLYIKRVLP